MQHHNIYFDNGKFECNKAVSWVILKFYQASCVIGLHVLTSYVLLSYAYQHYIDVCRLIMQSSSYDFFGGLVSGIKKCDRPNNGMPKV